MRNSHPKPAFISWLDLSIPDQKLHFELVQSPFSTPNSILGATLAALTMVGVAVALSDDYGYLWLFSGFAMVGIGRTTATTLFRRNVPDADDSIAIKRWELFALVGAWTFAGLVGLTGAYTVFMHPGTDAEILINCCVLGYIAGISSRNASRPIISIGQIALTCLPFVAALLWRADLVHAALALFIGVLFVSLIMICRAVFDNILARQEAFRKIEKIAHRDTLTDLWNRTAFIQLLEERLAAGGNIALISIDLDRFKDINDTFGHQAGDAVLREVGSRIKSVIRPEDEVARIGGDEFLVMLVGTNELQTQAVAQRILATFSRPFPVNMTNNVCGASIGYAVAPMDGRTLEELFRNADLALYEAKKNGRAQIVRHNAAITQRYDNRVALEHDLQFALANNELELAYQPIVDPRSGRAICCEALLRWNHPRRGRVSPDEFIPIAEATGLIVPIGAWVLATACVEATNWPSDIRVAVNLSPVQFRRGSELVQTVRSALREAELPASRLDLEVTESVLIEDGAAVLAVLEEMRAGGIGISLDDFGTGFASLSYLNDFPFSKIKIDRKFSMNIDVSTRTAAIIGGIAKTTRDLRIELVAEGIETENQLERMREFGINAVQGFLFCRPMPSEELRRVIGAPILPAFTEPRRLRPAQDIGMARKAAS
jgi:diguanylate cyclase (GGDEF)-like protein